jgi:predicted aldo/keto reductase-like oxidoreductase
MTMKYRKLGNSGLSVSNLILGTMGFGTETPEEEALAILDAFLGAGGNMIDTADVYGGGASEELLGRWWASRPDQAIELGNQQSAARHSRHQHCVGKLPAVGLSRQEGPYRLFLRSQP